jgi:hemolysin activation/secretion protein
VPLAVEQLRFLLRDIRIVGATKIPPKTFEPLIAPLRGHEVTLHDINAVADAIESQYHAAGYPITRAFVPPQRVSNGIFTIRVVEGFVGGASVHGGDPAERALIRGYMDPVVGAKPLEMPALERALLLANDLPGVAASGLLRPSPNLPGASDLVVSITQTPVSGDVSIDNRGSLDRSFRPRG